MYGLLSIVKGRYMTNFANILIMIGSAVSIGFGLWHLFVPQIWKWYVYIDVNATELILAVRAINVFFSVSLILFGIINLFLVLSNKSNRFSIIVVLSATCILWLIRTVFQIIYPQGTINPFLQYGMLIVFTSVFLCYSIALYLIAIK